MRMRMLARDRSDTLIAINYHRKRRQRGLSKPTPIDLGTNACRWRGVEHVNPRRQPNRGSPGQLRLRRRNDPPKPRRPAHRSVDVRHRLPLRPVVSDELAEHPRETVGVVQMREVTRTVEDLDTAVG